MIEVKNIKIEHVLILIIVAFALYHIIVNCSCMHIREGFNNNVCHFKYGSVQPYDGTCADPKCEKYNENECGTKYYSRVEGENNEKVLKNFWCTFRDNKCMGGSEQVQPEPGSSCPTCNNIFKLPDENNTSKYQMACKMSGQAGPGSPDTCKEQFSETDVYCSPNPNLDCMNEPLDISIKKDGTPDDTKCITLKERADKLHAENSFLGCVNETPLYNDMPIDYEKNGFIYDNEDDLFMLSKEQWACFEYLGILVFDYLNKHNKNGKDMTREEYENLISVNYDDLSLLFGCDKKALTGYYYNYVLNS